MRTSSERVGLALVAATLIWATGCGSERVIAVAADAHDAIGADVAGDDDTREDTAAQPDGAPKGDTRSDAVDVAVDADVGPTCPGGCPWDPDGCVARAALLEVVVLDLWGRPVADSSVAVTANDGAVLTSDAALAPLCGPATLTLVADAADHHPMRQTLTWTGPSAEAPLVSAGAMPFGGAVVATRASRDVAGELVPVVTIWVGLAHRWFAASAPPWHPNTPVELLMNGEVAWSRVAEDIATAEDLVTLTTWWWRSDFELVRAPPGDSVMQTAAQRRANTVMTALDATPAAKKVLVTQFVSQDGLFSDLNVDGPLLARGATPGDGFDFMGQANTSAGAFTVTPRAPDFGAALAAARPEAAAAAWLHEVSAEALVGPIGVDMSDLPLGLGAFDIPIASWHQKLVTVDQRVAFVGGMNLDVPDWDGDAHLVFDPRRVPFDTSAAARREILEKKALPEQRPTVDYMTRFTGPAVRDVVEVFHRRWAHQLAAGVRFAEHNTPFDLAAAAPGASGDGVALQVVATMPEPFAEYGILETLLRAIGQAEHYIFIQDQYFRAPLLAEAIAARMAELPELQLIVVTNPVGEWFDPGCWQTALQHALFAGLFPDRYSIFALRSFDYVRTDCTFCWDETDGYFVEHYMHAKLVLIDDVYLEVGSANHNNRGLLYEGELAVAIYDAAWVAEQRHRIVGHLIGADYDPTTTMSDLSAVFRAAAAHNQAAYDAWDAEGMDLALDGAPLPAMYQPRGFVYPLALRAPNKCLIEGVGPDIM